MFRNILVIKIHQYKCYQQQHAIKIGTFGPPGISVGVQSRVGLATRPTCTSHWWAFSTSMIQSKQHRF